MSAYSMPLWTIFTKWPAPSAPTCVQHGVPSTWAEIDSSSGPSDAYASAVPPGMMLGPLSAPSSPPEIPPPPCPPPAPGGGQVCVAAVDEDVARLQQRRELVDHRVGRAAGLDHDDD